MRKDFVLALLVGLSLATLVATPRNVVGANEVTVLTDKQSYNVGQTVQITLVYNGPVVTLTFPTSCVSTASVQATNGTTVATLNQICLQVITTLTLTPGQNIGGFSWIASIPGNYVIVGTVIGTSYSGTKQITVTSADFALSATPSSIVTPIGTLGTSTVNVTSLNGFSGAVSLADTVPAGLTCTAISPSNVTLPPSPATTSVSCESTVAGSFGLTITGTSGTLSHSITVQFVVCLSCDSWSIVATSPAPVPAISSATSTIIVTALNGFTGTVALTDSVPAGLVCGAIVPNTITLGTSGTATLSCSSTVAGTLSVSITATSATSTHATSATFTFTDFIISATSPAGGPATLLTSTITLTSVSGFTGTVALTDSVPAGLICGAITPNNVTFGTSPQTATLTCSFSVAGNLIVVITGTSGNLSHTATATFGCGSCDFTISASSPFPVPVGTSATSTIMVTFFNGFTGTVNLTDTVPAGLTCGAISPNSLAATGAATVPCSTTVAGDFVLTITGTSGALSHSATATFTICDCLSLAASSPAAVPVGTQATSTITVTSINGFTGTIVLTDTVSPNLTCGAITPGSVTGSGTATVSCSSTIAGTYTLTITGTSGTFRHSATATFTFFIRNDFSIEPSTPVTLDCRAATVCNTIVAVGALGQFAGTVSLTANPSPGLIATLAQNNLTLTIGGFASTTLYLSANKAGNYTVTVTGMSGMLAHTTGSITLRVTLPDFTITANPASLTIGAGSETTSAITILALDGFQDVVSLTATASPSSGVTVTLGPTQVTMSGTSTLTFTASTPGSYIVTVTGSSGNLVHSTTVSVEVLAPPNVPPPQFTQSNWKHRLSLSKNNYTQTWTVGVKNPSSNTTIYVRVLISAVDGAGSSFSVTSNVVQLGPNKSMTGIQLTKSFTATSVGDTYIFSTVIIWGTSADMMIFQSTATSSKDIMTAGSFTILA